MAETSDTNPQIRDINSPLDTLMFLVLRRYGDFNPGTIDGEVSLMFLGFANEIIDEIRSHPYWDGTPLNYYKAVSEVRPISDIILVTGLLAKYAEQQMSSKVQSYAPKYFRTLNQQLWYRLNGNTKIEVRKKDDPTPRDPNNGLATQ